MSRYILIQNFKDTGQHYQQRYFDYINDVKETIGVWKQKTGNMEYHVYKKIDIEKDKP